MIAVRDVSPTISQGAPFSKTGNSRVECEALVAHSLRGEGFDASEDGTGRGTPIAPVSAARMVAFGEYVDDGVASAMKQRDYKDATDLVYPINTQIATRHKEMGEGTGMGIGADGDAAYTLQAAHGHAVATLVSNGDAHSGFRDEQGLAIQPGMQVRRLTPLECERLQGFPDNYTNIPRASDSARYKALGNSMAVNVMQLIGQRIRMVEDIQ